MSSQASRSVAESFSNLTKLSASTTTHTHHERCYSHADLPAVTPRLLKVALGSLAKLEVLNLSMNKLTTLEPLVNGNFCHTPHPLESFLKLPDHTPSKTILNLSKRYFSSGDLPNLLTFSADFNQLAALDLPYASLARYVPVHSWTYFLPSTLLTRCS